MTSDTKLPHYALEVSPESTLQFTITPNPLPSIAAGNSCLENSADEHASRCTLTLRHTGRTKESLAFKVKTTNPRRYLVRPNQGIVSPGSSETIVILLVDKDRQVLWSTYERLGQSALEHSKDKFLIQSSAVSDEFVAQFRAEKVQEEKKDSVNLLTSLWNTITAKENDVPVYNAKLRVQHTVDDSNRIGTGLSTITAEPASAWVGKGNNTLQNSQQLFDEVTSLRRKYDELVSFSVNLTAERDILNNTLEQTRRDLNREMATRQTLEKQGFRVGPSSRLQDKKSRKTNGTVSFQTLLLVGILSFLVAIKATNSGFISFFKYVPVLGSFLGFRKSDIMTEPLSGMNAEL